MDQLSQVVGCALGVTLLTGCSAGPTATPAAAVEDAVRSYSSAYLSGDGQKAHDKLSARCNKMISLEKMKGRFRRCGCPLRSSATYLGDSGGRW